MSDDVRYYRVSPRFWSTTTHWSDDARLLALYLLTCPHRTVEGLFRLPKPYIQADLQWLPERLDKPFQELLDDGFIEYDEHRQVVLIVKALKYQAPANDNVTTKALRQLEEVPDSSLDQRFLALAEDFCERLAERLPERFRQPFAKPPTPTPTPTPTPPKAVSPRGDAPHPEETFEEFWTAYPRHHSNGLKGGGAPRKDTRAKWGRLKPDERQDALVAVRHYAQWIDGDPNADFPCHALTWLNQRRWDDWQEPAEQRTSLRDMPRSVRESHTYDNTLAEAAELMRNGSDDGGLRAIEGGHQ